MKRLKAGIGKCWWAYQERGIFVLLGPDPVKSLILSSQHPILQLPLLRYSKVTLVKQFLWKRTSILSELLFSRRPEQKRRTLPIRQVSEFGKVQQLQQIARHAGPQSAPTCVEPTRTELNGVKFFAAAANQAHSSVPQLVSSVEEHKRIRAPNLQLQLARHCLVIRKFLISAAQY